MMERQIIVHCTKPRHRCGKMVFEMVKDIKVVNLLGFLGVYGKPKDTLEVRQDLQCTKQEQSKEEKQSMSRKKG